MGSSSGLSLGEGVTLRDGQHQVFEIVAGRLERFQDALRLAFVEHVKFPPERIDHQVLHETEHHLILPHGEQVLAEFLQPGDMASVG